MDDQASRGERVQRLTERQREVLRLICEGQSYEEIANVLVITVAAVNKHAENIYDKLGISHIERGARRVELGKFCRELVFPKEESILALPEPGPEAIHSIAPPTSDLLTEASPPLPSPLSWLTRREGRWRRHLLIILSIPLTLTVIALATTLIPRTHTPLNLGDERLEVCEAQYKLNLYHQRELNAGRLGLKGAPLAEDCKFGPRTYDAVLSFQQQKFADPQYHLGNRIGPSTWAELDKIRTPLQYALFISVVLLSIALVAVIFALPH